jgi:membrane protein DedA with SNARE-associated domain
MPVALVTYITKYGLIAIFSLVFLQEIGVPNPVPNELVLLFSGYLTSIGTMSFILVMITVVSADFVGTSILYFFFFFLGQRILQKNFRWLPKEKIERLSKRISERGQWGIYVGRLIPYLRGYTSVAAGLLRIKPKIFLPAVLISALTWSGGYAVAGRLLGKGYENLVTKLSAGKIALAGIVLLVFIFFIWPKINYHLKSRRKKDKV